MAVGAMTSPRADFLCAGASAAYQALAPRARSEPLSGGLVKRDGILAGYDGTRVVTAPEIGKQPVTHDLTGCSNVLRDTVIDVRIDDKR
jgi:hypothetical protein